MQLVVWEGLELGPGRWHDRDIPPAASVAGCETRRLAGLCVVGYHAAGLWNVPWQSVSGVGSWQCADRLRRSCLKKDARSALDRLPGYCVGTVPRAGVHDAWWRS